MLAHSLEGLVSAQGPAPERVPSTGLNRARDKGFGRGRKGQMVTGMGRCDINTAYKVRIQIAGFAQRARFNFLSPEGAQRSPHMV